MPVKGKPEKTKREPKINLSKLDYKEAVSGLLAVKPPAKKKKA